MRCSSQLMIVQWLAGWQGVILQLPSHQIEFRFSIFGLCTLHSQKRLCYKENAINLNFHQKNITETRPRRDTIQGDNSECCRHLLFNQAHVKRTISISISPNRRTSISIRQAFVLLVWTGLDWAGNHPWERARKGTTGRHKICLQ